MGMSTVCVHANVTSKKMPEYVTTDFGITLHLVEAVLQEMCSDCGEVLQFCIPNTAGLIAAAAVTRVKMPQKLTGKEIKFIRKALELPSKDLADILDVTPETFSRWENDKMPMSPTTEKLFRILTGLTLVKQTPAISFRPQEILDMNINAVRNREEQLTLSFQLVRSKDQQERVVDAYSEAA